MVCQRTSLPSTVTSGKPLTLHKSYRQIYYLLQACNHRAGRVGGDPKVPLPASNRTCGFPASGSPKRVSPHAFAVRFPGKRFNKTSPKCWKCSCHLTPSGGRYGL